MCNCTTPCEPNCSNNCPEPTIVPMPQCFLINPCNDGCVETFSTDCVIVKENIGLFYKGQTLTSVLQQINTLAPLIAEYNTSNSPQLVMYSFTVDKYPVTVTVTQNGVPVINSQYTSSSLLLAALSSLDSSWQLVNQVFSVKGTSTWQISLSY